VATTDTLLPLLALACPQAEFLSCPAYDISYSKSTILMPVKLFGQIPGVILTMYKERRWLQKVVKKQKITAIISDNRFGFYHPSVPSVYLTHQLHIKTGYWFTDRIAAFIHRLIIKKYQHCWVPDFADAHHNLAGELSHGQAHQPTVTYLGALSRFETMPPTEKQYDLLVILSGPEPQRSLFENMVAAQLANTTLQALIVRGLPQQQEHNLHLPTNGCTDIKNHLDSPLLNQAIAASRMVLCRSGYTSIMDLVKLQQPAILVPTPGQTEQEYLARHCMQTQLFYTTSQHHFQLQDAMAKAHQFRNQFVHFNMEQYKNVVQQFVETL
jgi:predicted glycosyltransferase